MTRGGGKGGVQLCENDNNRRTNSCYACGYHNVQLVYSKHNSTGTTYRLNGGICRTGDSPAMMQDNRKDDDMKSTRVEKEVRGSGWATLINGQDLKLQLEFVLDLAFLRRGFIGITQYVDFFVRVALAKQRRHWG